MLSDESAAKPAPIPSARNEMAGLIASRSWSTTALGDRNDWSPSLKLIVEIMLASGFPMAVRWGPEFILVYNDGYRPILGDKHPWALGLPFRQAWPEVQGQLGGLHEQLLSGARKAVYFDDLLLRIRRRGESTEDAYFTVSYSPVRDETAPSGIGG